MPRKVHPSCIRDSQLRFPSYLKQNMSEFKYTISYFEKNYKPTEDSIKEYLKFFDYMSIEKKTRLRDILLYTIYLGINQYSTTII